MRSLKKLLEKIYRKSALTLVKRGGPGVPPDTLSGSGPVVAADSSAAQAADGGAKGVLGTVTAALDSSAESSHSAAAEGQAAPDSSDSDSRPASSSEANVGTAASSAPAASADSQQPDGQLPATSPQVNKPCTGLAAHCSKA